MRLAVMRPTIYAFMAAVYAAVGAAYLPSRPVVGAVWLVGSAVSVGTVGVTTRRAYYEGGADAMRRRDGNTHDRLGFRLDPSMSGQDLRAVKVRCPGEGES